MSTQWYGVICVETDETTGKITATLDDQNPNHYNDEIVIRNPIHVDEIIYNRTFTAGLLSSLCVPFTINPSEVSNATFYKINSVDLPNRTITLTESDSIIPANTPCMLKATTNGSILFNSPTGYTLQTNYNLKNKVSSDVTMMGIYKYTKFTKEMLANEPYKSGCVYAVAGADEGDIVAGTFVPLGTDAYCYPFRSIFVKTHIAVILQGKKLVLKK